MPDMPLSSESNHTMSLQPQPLDFALPHNWRVEFSLGRTLVPEHAHTHATKSELFIEADKLFFAGDKKGLMVLYKIYNSWSSATSFNVQENKMIAQHIEKLLANKHLSQFAALKNAQQNQVKPILREIFKSTKDPLIRSEAVILADNLVGGIICNYGSEFSLRPIHDEALDLMVATRFGTHAIDKILPKRGESLNKAKAHTFTRKLLSTLESVPECMRESLLSYAVQGFVNRSMSPGTTFSQYKWTVTELTTCIYDEVLGYYLKGPEYEQLRKQEIARFGADLDARLSKYSNKDWAYACGAAVSDSCAIRAIIHIGTFAYKHLVAPIVCPKARMTVEDLLSKCTVNKTTPPQKTHCGVKDMSCPQTYQQFIQDLKEISVTPIREIAKSDGLRSLGKDATGKTLIVRSMCNNPFVSKETPTFEIQPINRTAELTIKIRGKI